MRRYGGTRGLLTREPGRARASGAPDAGLAALDGGGLAGPASNTRRGRGPGGGWGAAWARRRWRVPWLLAVPCAAFLVAFYLWPLLVSVYVSLTRLNVFYLANWLHAPFIAFGNYRQLFNPATPFGQEFLSSLKAAGIFTGSAIVVGLPLGVLGAVAMNRPMLGRGVFRALFILPYAIPVYVSALIWRLMLIQRVGLIDHIAGLLVPGAGATYWLIGPNAIWSIVMANTWASWPFFYLFALGAMQGIPQELYEAGALDGAGGGSAFRRITLPLIKRPLLIATALSFIYHFNNFTTPFVMFGTTAPPAATTLPLTAYLFGFTEENFGAATAMSVLSMVVLMIPMMFYLRSLRLNRVETLR